MKILVTGGLGFVGTNLVKRLVDDNHQVTVIDNLSAGKLENKIKGVKYLIMHTKEISNNFEKFDLVFHLGEYSKVAPSFNEVDNVFDLNILGSFAVLEYCRHNNIPLIYSASSTRLASEGEGHSPYAFFKSTIVGLIKNYSEWYNLKYSICYFYNAYGPYHDTCNNGWETVISIFEKQYKSKQPLTICGDGQQRRDFTYVGDIIEGLILASNKLENDEYQLGSGRDYSILEIAKMFGSEIKFVNSRPGDRKTSLANTEETKEKLGWIPKMNLDNWIKNIILKHNND
jgi:UDP-glucose 4-epimerase